MASEHSAVILNFLKYSRATRDAQKFIYFANSGLGKLEGKGQSNFA